jgi:hypothetical protein
MHVAARSLCMPSLRRPPAGVVGRDILAQQGESAAGERSKGYGNKGQRGAPSPSFRHPLSAMHVAARSLCMPSLRRTCVSLFPWRRVGGESSVTERRPVSIRHGFGVRSSAVSSREANLALVDPTSVCALVSLAFRSSCWTIDVLEQNRAESGWRKLGDGAQASQYPARLRST